MAAPASLTKLTASSTLSSVGFSSSTVNSCALGTVSGKNVHMHSGMVD
jgi:hypothetical protein